MLNAVLGNCATVLNRNQYALKMRLRSRIRNIAKWILLALTIGSFSLWIVSGWRYLSYGHYWFAMSWNYGRFGLTLLEGSEWTYYTGWAISSVRARGFLWDPGNTITVTHGYYGARALIRWWIMPGWIPPVAIFVPTVVLFIPDWFAYRARRRIAKGLCSYCAFNLAGLSPDSKCPECGKTRN